MEHQCHGNYPCNLLRHHMVCDSFILSWLHDYFLFCSLKHIQFHCFMQRIFVDHPFPRSSKSLLSSLKLTPVCFHFDHPNRCKKRILIFTIDLILLFSYFWKWNSQLCQYSICMTYKLNQPRLHCILATEDKLKMISKQLASFVCQ